MTEAEWLACDDPNQMLQALSGIASERKLRLFGCACVRRIWHLLPNPINRRGVEAIERFVDTSGTMQQWRQAAGNANIGADDAARAAAFVADYRYLGDPVGLISGIQYAAMMARSAGGDAEWKSQIGLLREVFGPLPFRSVAFAPVFRTANVSALAQTIYVDRAFDRLLILAGALEDAGCTNEEILKHCRSGGVHVRGCWVVDLVLGRE